MEKILVLGNEFLEEDSFAKKVCENMNFTGINDSFELMDALQTDEDVIIIDVVKGLNHVARIQKEDLRNDSFLSAHDLDAGFLITLLSPEVKIIGIPQNGNIEEIRKELLKILKPIDF